MKEKTNRGKKMNEGKKSSRGKSELKKYMTVTI